MNVHAIIAEFLKEALSPVDKAVIVGVSGGSDSLALLFVLQELFGAMPAAPDLIAVTIDHGLRAESAFEAQSVARLCAENGIAHRVLVWQGSKPVTGISAAARAARYGLLVQAARDAGATCIFTGHTQDDQIETFLMRKQRSKTDETSRGLAGMHGVSLLEGDIGLLRPFLNVLRRELRAWLQQRGIVWFDDPTNADTHYERPHIRHNVAAGCDSALVLQEIATAAANRDRQNNIIIQAIEAVPRALHMAKGDVLELDATMLASVPEDEQALLIGALVSLLGGKEFLPGTIQRQRLQSHLAATETARRIGLGGCVIERAHGGRLCHLIWRERRNLPDVQVAGGKTMIWDGRYKVYNGGKDPIQLRAVERQRIKGFCESHNLDIAGAHSLAMLSSPAIIMNSAIIALPALQADGEWREGIDIKRHFALFDHILSGHDVALAERLVETLKRDITHESANFCKPES